MQIVDNMMSHVQKLSEVVRVNIVTVCQDGTNFATYLGGHFLKTAYCTLHFL